MASFFFLQSKRRPEVNTRSVWADRTLSGGDFSSRHPVSGTCWANVSLLTQKVTLICQSGTGRLQLLLMSCVSFANLYSIIFHMKVERRKKIQPNKVWQYSLKGKSGEISFIVSKYHKQQYISYFSVVLQSSCFHYNSLDHHDVYWSDNLGSSWGSVDLFIYNSFISPWIWFLIQRRDSLLQFGKITSLLNS